MRRYFLQATTLLFSVAVILSCGHGYGVVEDEIDHTTLSAEDMKSQQADMQFLEQFYHCYLDALRKDPSPSTHSDKGTVADSTADTMVSPLSMEPSWRQYLRPALRYQLEHDSTGFDPFLASNDIPDHIEFSITPLSGSPGWYEMNYPAANGAMRSVCLEVKYKDHQRQITQVRYPKQ